MFAEDAVKKLLVFIGTVLVMTACSEAPSAPSSARKAAPSIRPNGDATCRSGYAIAYDQDGNPYCAPGDQGIAPIMMSGMARPDSVP